MLKRVFDLTVSITVLILMTPFLLGIAILIKCDTHGPVLFRQKRVGRFGEPFWIFKFRSMVRDAADQGPYFTSAGDARITRVGQFLRKTSLDELPQLLNVIRGEMSFVGPRPNVYEQRSDYSDSEWESRNSVLPGITGLSQATNRSAATVKQRNELDLLYVSRKSLMLDLRIMLMTVRQVLTIGGN